MLKLSNKLLELDDNMRSHAKMAQNLLLGMLFPKDGQPRQRRRKIDKQLGKLLCYLQKIDNLGYRLKLDIVAKGEVMDRPIPKIFFKKKEKEVGHVV